MVRWRHSAVRKTRSLTELGWSNRVIGFAGPQRHATDRRQRCACRHGGRLPASARVSFSARRVVAGFAPRAAVVALDNGWLGPRTGRCRWRIESTPGFGRSAPEVWPFYFFAPRSASSTARRRVVGPTVAGPTVVVLVARGVVPPEFARMMMNDVRPQHRHRRCWPPRSLRERPRPRRDLLEDFDS